MARPDLSAMTSPGVRLTAIKAAHTVVWAFFVACIAAIWICAATGRLAWAAGFIGVVSVEVVVLILNRLHCPLTPIAARYTDDRRANFDIYLPEWLAKRTREIFGGLYAGAILFTLARWALAVALRPG